jgi:hypothetical protein
MVRKEMDDVAPFQKKREETEFNFVCVPSHSKLPISNFTTPFPNTLVYLPYNPSNLLHPINLTLTFIVMKFISLLPVILVSVALPTAQADMCGAWYPPAQATTTYQTPAPPAYAPPSQPQIPPAKQYPTIPAYQPPAYYPTSSEMGAGGYTTTRSSSGTTNSTPTQHGPAPPSSKTSSVSPTQSDNAAGRRFSGAGIGGYLVVGMVFLFLLPASILREI